MQDLREVEQPGGEVINRDLHPGISYLARGEESDSWMEGLYWTQVDLLCPTQGMFYGLIDISTDRVELWMFLCLSCGIQPPCLWSC